MIVLGIDPGSRKTGYAVLKVVGAGRSILGYGTIILTDLDSMPDKLARIFERVDTILRRYDVNSVAVEAGFYGKNAQSAYKLGYARSAAVLSAVVRKISVTEYSPRKVKQAVTGNGGASKSQVKYMVKKILKIAESEELKEDEADACAVAICHVQNLAAGAPHYRNWKEFVENNKHLIVNRGPSSKIVSGRDCK